MNKKEIDEARWSNYRDEVPIDSSLLEESLGILNSIHESSADVVNWEERAEMARVAQQHGHLIQKSDNNYYSDQPEGTQDLNEQGGSDSPQGRSDNPYENELMSQLGSIMGQLEGHDDKK